MPLTTFESQDPEWNWPTRRDVDRIPVGFGPQDRKLKTPFRMTCLYLNPELQLRMKVRVYGPRSRP